MKHLHTGLRFFLLMTLVTGLGYPLLITGIAKLMIPYQSTGSIVSIDGKPRGSALVGQNFKSPQYFWPRPSAINYDPLKPSGGSNLGPTSKKLQETVASNIKKWESTPENIPAELVYSSGSGLDPHITVKGAYFQIERISKARGESDPNTIKSLVDNNSQDGEKVNVLLLNQALDEHYSVKNP
ncbi:MAG: potassium-transporting ATPase subunit KdpC [Parachlamydiales bacterium]|jgi:K+-transporting ATPase ATPase C chain